MEDERSGEGKKETKTERQQIICSCFMFVEKESWRSKKEKPRGEKD